MERERRAHPRKRVSTTVAFHDPGGAPLRGWLHDISRGGCFIASPSHLTFGEPIEFELRLPGNAPVIGKVVGKGRVAWVRAKSQRELPAGMGIRFVEVPEEFLEAIDGLNGRGPTLSRPDTVKGIAPAPPTSSPSFSPDVVLELLAEMKTDPLEQVDAPPPPQPPAAPPTPAEPPPPTPSPLGPPPTLDLQRPSSWSRVPRRWLIAGVAAIAIVGAGGLIALAVSLVRSSGGKGSNAVLDAAPAEPASQAVAAESAGVAATEPDAGAIELVDTGVVDAGTRDAGRDAGHAQPKPKPKSKPHR